jgi:hypothetical protein
MNWFQRHLNWTWFLVAIVGSYVIGLIFGLAAGSTSPYAFYTSLGTLYWLMYSLSALLVLIISIWVLRRKNQSLWWLLILFLVPLVGWIIFLCLENHSEFAELRDTEGRAVGPPPKRAVPPPQRAGPPSQRMGPPPKRMGPPPKRMGPPPKMKGPPPQRRVARDITDWD